MLFNPDRIPADIVGYIVEHLSSRKDLYRCALVNRVFHAAAIPLLWRTLDVRMKPWARPGKLLHPSAVLVQKPRYSGYVVEIQEDSWISMVQEVLQERLAALRLCANLRSFSWTDSSTLGENDAAFIAHLDVLQQLRVTDLSVKISSGISPVVWRKLMQTKGLRRLALSSSQCVPEGLSAWAERSSRTMTHLEFSVISEADHYPRFITQLPHLQSLRLDAPTSIIPDLLTYVPHLVTLDIRYRHSEKVPAPTRRMRPTARLRELTVHVVHGRGVEGLWEWITQLVPHPASLQSLTIHSRARPGFNRSFPVLAQFLRHLAELHGASVRRILFFNLVVAPLDIEFVCNAFPMLEALSFSPDEHESRVYKLVDSSIRAARHLKALTIHSSSPIPGAFDYARRWMSRTGRSQLLSVTIGPETFKGKWVRDESLRLGFEISRQEDGHDRWM